MIEERVMDFIQNPKRNSVSKADALDESVIGLKLFDTPLIGYADAADALFERFKTDPEITGGRFMQPLEWLHDAHTVVSIFMPYSREIKSGNRRDMITPSNEWLHARYEGQKLVNELSRYLIDELTKRGYQCVAPGIDDRFKSFLGTGTSEKKVMSIVITAVTGLSACGLCCRTGNVWVVEGTDHKKGYCREIYQYHN